MPITFGGNPTPSGVITQRDADRRYINPTFWSVPSLSNGWTSTSIGGGTGITQGALTLAVRSATTVDFGSITAYINQSGPNAFRLGTGNGAGGYATLNFSNRLLFSIRMGTVFNFVPTKTNWAFVVGTQAKNVAGLSAVLLPALPANQGYCALECLSGSLRIVTQSFAASAIRSDVVDTWATGQNHKAYTIDISGGILTLIDGFNGTVIGSLSGAPTYECPPQQLSPIAFVVENNAPGTTVNDQIVIYNLAMGFQT